MDIVKHNRKAWDKEVDLKDKWTILVSSEEVDKARHGFSRILLTPTKFVPSSWYENIKDKKVLCLA